VPFKAAKLRSRAAWQRFKRHDVPFKVQCSGATVQCPSDVQCTCGAVQSSKAAFNALKRGSRTAKQWFNALRAFNAAELRIFLQFFTKASPRSRAQSSKAAFNATRARFKESGAK
jgi:hypothetical protein